MWLPYCVGCNAALNSFSIITFLLSFLPLFLGVVAGVIRHPLSVRFQFLLLVRFPPLLVYRVAMLLVVVVPFQAVAAVCFGVLLAVFFVSLLLFFLVGEVVGVCVCLPVSLALICDRLHGWLRVLRRLRLVLLPFGWRRKLRDVGCCQLLSSELLCGR